MRPTTALVTGFGPFPGVVDNASALLAVHVAANASRAGLAHSVVGAVLPTEWRRAPLCAEELIATHQPDVVVHFGVCRSARGFALEHHGHNACAATLDAVGELPSAPHICADGPHSLPASLPLERIAAHLRDHDYPVEMSNDAGRYLCNATLYQSLNSSRDAARLVGFIHIPTDLGPDSPLNWPRAISGACAIVRLCLEDAAARTHRR